MEKAKILIVDDEEIFLVATKRELEAAGHDVKTALSGKEAVEIAKKEKFDIVYTDLVLPQMNGVETCKAIKKVSPDSTLIFMTGAKERFADKEFEFTEAGGKTYYLYKPFLEGEILKVTKQALAEKAGAKQGDFLFF